MRDSLCRRVPARFWSPAMGISWLLLLIAVPAAGQATWSLEPRVGYALASELFGHDISRASPVDGSLLVRREE